MPAGRHPAISATGIAPAWIRALDANMLTPIELIKSTIDRMITRRFGRIVNITSSSVKMPIDILGLSNGARSGLTGFVAGLARKVASNNVTINNLLPGSFDTDRLRTNYEGRAKAAAKPIAELMAAGAAAIPAGRFGRPDEFGAVCAFICSAHAGYLVGRTFCSTAATTQARSDGTSLFGPSMIDLYYWTTPNGHKITIFLEETGVPHPVIPVNISAGEQFEPAFLAISPNNRIPAIVDHAPADGGGPMSLMGVGRDPPVPRGKDASTPAGRPSGQVGLPAVGVLADGRTRTDGPDRITTSTCTRSRRFRMRSIAMYAKPAGSTQCSTSGSPIGHSSPVNIRSPTSPAIRGCSRNDRSRTSRRSLILRAGWRRSPARPAVQRAYAFAKTINVKPAVSDEKSRAILFGQSKDSIV